MKLFSRLLVRTKLALVMTFLIGLISLVIYVHFPARLKRQAVSAIISKSQSLAEMAAFSVGPGLFFQDRPGVDEALAAIRQNGDLVYVIVLDSSDQPFASFNDGVADQYDYRRIPMAQREEETGVLRRAEPRTLGGFSADGSLYQTTAAVRYKGRPIGRVYLGLSLDRLNAQIAGSRATVAFVSLIIFVFGVAAVVALSRVITGPLSRIVETAERIAAGDLGRRAEVSHEDEVGVLARSFNLMVDKLAAAQRDLEGLNRSLESRVETRTKQILEEIEERKRAEGARLLSEERHRLLIERNLAGVYVVSADGRILECNDACAHIFGFPSRASFIAQGGSIEYFDPHDRESLLARLSETKTVTNREVRLSTRTGAPVWALENVRLIEGENGRPGSLEGILLDITDRKRTEQEMEFRAYHDPLTGLPNRALFDDRLRVALAQARRNHAMMAVMFLDVDDLKVLNDTFGHSTGDRLLQVMAERLSESLREGDTVARIGGDEFTVLLPEIDSEEAAAEVARKIQERLSAPFLVGEDEVHVTISIGAALYPSDGDDVESLSRNADGTMYRVKEEGGNGFQLCSRTSSSKALGRLSIEQQLRRALDHGEFVSYYQPIVDAHTREITSVEALVRWKHPENIVIEPAGFISAAEYSGLILPMGKIVLREACLQMKKWQDAGVPRMGLAVNVSARQLHQRDFTGMVEQILEDTGLDPRSLELEITESVAMRKSDSIVRLLTRLREMGIRIAMDDFGTGQSSLSYLKNFPIDTLKIDRSFVADVAAHGNVESIVIAILAMAEGIGLRTVAEGVETEAQWKFLEAHGCHEIQGYLFSRPRPAEVIESLFLKAASPVPARS